MLGVTVSLFEMLSPNSCFPFQADTLPAAAGPLTWKSSNSKALGVQLEGVCCWSLSTSSLKLWWAAWWVLESLLFATRGKCGVANLSSLLFFLHLRAVSADTGYLPNPVRAFSDAGLWQSDLSRQLERWPDLQFLVKNTGKLQLSPSRSIPLDKKRGLWLKLWRNEWSLDCFLFSGGSAQGMKEGERSQPCGGWKLAMPRICCFSSFPALFTKLSSVVFLCLQWWNRLGFFLCVVLIEKKIIL